MTDTLLPTGRSLLVSNAARLIEALRAAGPPLLFGLRLWASVSLALYVAYWLELDNPFWAGTSAAIVCQPQLGASLRKGWFRLVGTVIGAAMSLVLVACFPQDRVLFLGCLTVWAAACAFAATLLHNFASYAAALAGYTVRSLPATCSARPAAWMQTLRSCLPLPGPARSASASSVLVSFSPSPISAAQDASSLRSSRICRRRSPPGLSAHWQSQDMNSPTRSPSVTNSFVASSPSIP